MSNFEKAIRKSSYNFKKDLSLFALLCIKKFADVIPYVPEVVQREFLKGFYDNLTMQFSNVPLSEKPWFVCNTKAKRVAVFTHNHHQTKIFFVASTYQGELFLTAMANKSMRMDPQQLIDYMSEFIEDEISKFGEGQSTNKIKEE